MKLLVCAVRAWKCGALFPLRPRLWQPLPLCLGVACGVEDSGSSGWDEHEVTHMVFEYGEEEGMRMMEELSLEDDANSVVFQGGVVQEPRVCLALNELIPVNEVRQPCEAPEPAKKRPDSFS